MYTDEENEGSDDDGSVDSQAEAIRAAMQAVATGKAAGKRKREAESDDDE